MSDTRGKTAINAETTDRDEEETETTNKDTDEENIQNNGEEEDEGYNKQISCYTQPRHMDAESIPVEIRLNVHRHTQLDVIRQRVPIPKQALPSTSLPGWSLLPLDTKIPNVLGPTGAFVLARGSLGQKLHLRKQEYSVYDPCHKERVIFESYNSLHDPHAKGYLNKPCVKKILFQQGLITKDGRVLCSLQQFNKYRTYLRTIYNQSLEKYINQEYEHFKYDAETVKKLERYESATTSSGKEFIKQKRREHALQVLKAKREESIRRYEAKQEADNKRYRCYLEDKLRAKMNNCLISEEKKRIRKERMCRAISIRNMKAQRLKMAVIAKDMAVQHRLESDKKYVLEAYQHFVTEWLLAKWEYQAQRIERDGAVRESLKNDLEEKTQRRLVRVEKYRELMLIIQERRKEDHVRLWKIVRKYFVLWRDKVRARKAELPDDKHQSLWDISAALENTNQYMHDQTGIGKFDDFILSILKLKSTIKAQLKKEQAEAALAEAAAAADGDDDKDSDEKNEKASTATMDNNNDIANFLDKIPAPKLKSIQGSNSTLVSTTLQFRPKRSSYASIKRSTLRTTLGKSRHVTRIQSNVRPSKTPSTQGSKNKVKPTTIKSEPNNKAPP